MGFNEARFRKTMRERYGVRIDDDEADALRLVFAEPVRHRSDRALRLVVGGTFAVGACIGVVVTLIVLAMAGRL